MPRVSAAAIWGRVAALFDGAMTPERVLATPDEAFRAAGFSASKTRSVKDLAEKASAGVVPLDRLRRMRDDEVVARLSEVRGIGRWTAEMFLIFTLRRMDVWPVLDYGVRNGYRIAYGLPEVPTPKALEPEGDRFRPYRTVAAWYCWPAVRTRGRSSDGAGQRSLEAGFLGVEQRRALARSRLPPVQPPDEHHSHGLLGGGDHLGDRGPREPSEILVEHEDLDGAGERGLHRVERGVGDQHDLVARLGQRVRHPGGQSRAG